MQNRLKASTTLSFDSHSYRFFNEFTIIKALDVLGEMRQIMLTSLFAIANNINSGMLLLPNCQTGHIVLCEVERLSI